MTTDDTADDDRVRCTTDADIRSADGRRATVVGTYRQVDVRQRPTGDPVYRGHAGVRLADGTTVHLEPTWSPDARRPEAEVERFEGRRVRVVGTVNAEPPAPPRPVAHVVSPCVSPVERVELVE